MPTTATSWRGTPMPAGHPFPALSETQGLAFSRIVDTVRGHAVSYQALPAGAGSGKTRLLVAVVNAMLAMGARPASVNAISFTNKSANEFRARVIGSHHEREHMIPDGPQNLEFQTIHSHAISILARLQPHVPGVAYYFEEAEETTDKEDEDAAEFRKSLKLAYSATLVYRDGNRTFHDAIRGYFGSETLFPAREVLDVPDAYAKATSFINEEMMTSAGLGAFTNVDDGGVNYPLAVCTDALLRLANDDAFSVERKREVLGLPEIVLIDEVQDIDPLQVLYFRALLANGVSIITVGDHRQTLYPWRHALGKLAFHEGFLAAMAPSGVHVRIASDTPLDENRRSRRGIVEFAERFAAGVRQLAETGFDGGLPYPNFRPIRDDGVQEFPGRPTIDTQGALRSISVLLGGPLAQDDKEKDPAPASAPKRGALAKLAKAQGDAPSRKKGRKGRQCQVSSLCGGISAEAIGQRISDLYERMRLGETCAVLMRNGATPDDIRLLRDIIERRRPTDALSGKVEIRLASPEKTACLSAYATVPAEAPAETRQGVPFSNLLVAAAIHFFMHDWDKESEALFKRAGFQQKISFIPAMPLDAGLREHLVAAGGQEKIRISLDAFFRALALRYGVEQVHRTIEDKAVEFVLTVLCDYVQLVRRAYGKDEASDAAWQIPCRFDACASDWVDPSRGSNARKLRKSGDQKFHFKTFWNAIANAKFPDYFGIQPVLDKMSEMKLEIPLVDDWTEGGSSLLSLPEDIGRHLELVAEPGTVLHTYRDELVRAREDSHKQFARLWHRKTRRFMKAVFAKVGRRNRQGSGAIEDVLQSVYDEAYRETVDEVGIRTGIWTNRHAKVEVTGLFRDLCKSPSEVVVRRVDRDAAKPKAIEVTTIHSSKGLEWDHVLFLFPKPMGNDKDTADAEVYRDLYYVAMTRARRTMTIVVDDKAEPDGGTSTANRILAPMLRALAREEGVLNAALDWTGDERGAVAEEGAVRVRDETSHSEAEDAMTCRIRHDLKHRREPPSMIPLSSPGYSFFFHGVMSSLVAEVARQRVTTADDEIRLIARAVEQAVKRQVKGEDAVRQHLLRVAGEEMYTAIEAMVPAYLIENDDDRYQRLTEFYRDSLAAHLAAIITGSSLFPEVLRGCDAGANVRIEKPTRTILRHREDRLPFVGIPDLRIEYPDEVRIYEYKSVPGKDDEEADEAYEKRLSLKTAFQVNLYQGVLGGDTKRHRAEIIYVRDVTVRETEPVPGATDPLPHLRGQFGFVAVERQKHARILETSSFDPIIFGRAGTVISRLRKEADERALCAPEPWYPMPLVANDGEAPDLEVKAEQCKTCPVAPHCHKNRNLIAKANDDAPVL